jgi:hypothetical protein
MIFVRVGDFRELTFSYLSKFHDIGVMERVDKTFFTSPIESNRNKKPQENASKRAFLLSLFGDIPSQKPFTVNSASSNSISARSIYAKLTFLPLSSSSLKVGEY